MKEYNIICQEEWNYCLCSVIQGIFNSYNLNLSQGEIANSLTPREKGFLVHDDGINRFFQDNGFSYTHYWWNQTPFNEPDSLLETKDDVILGWNNHALLMNAFKNQEVIYLDPKDTIQKSLSYCDLMKNMYGSKDGFFGLVKRL
ncbi:hypothetical protein KY321_03135 [Candidatus Woesearchaeota archaeon]|nr:hypothetical protein [Candidatus Woesearchaeota archaeon]